MNHGGRRAVGVVVLFAALVGVPTPVPAQTPTTPPALTSAPVATTAPPVRVVRLPFPQEDGSLTPYTFELGYGLVTLVYDTLLLRDRDGVPQPSLARSVDTSTDGTRVTVHLVPGARWHDDTPVTSADVAFTLRYVADHPQPRFSAQVRVIARVDTPDPETAIITLRHPAPGFADQPLADVPILPAHLWRSLPPGRTAPDGPPVGSGPYRLVEHQPGVSYKFVANEGYFGGRPSVSTIEVPIITGAEQTFQALEGRRVDMIPLSLNEDAAARLKGLVTKVVDGPMFLGTTLLMNVRRPPFDQPEVRRAVSEALDLRRIARAVGAAQPADRGQLHPASPWSARSTLHTFDVAAARQVLAGAAGLGPLEVLTPDNDPVKQEAAHQVAVALGRVGAPAKVRALTRADYEAALGNGAGGPGFQLAIGVTPPLASYDPDFLARIFGSDAADAALNQTGYRSQAFDAVAERIATTPDPERRRQVVEEALALLVTDAPSVPLFFSTGTFAYRPRVYDGWVFVKGAGILTKRSFLPTTRATAPPTTTPGSGLDDGISETPADFPLGIVVGGLLGVAALIAAFAVVRRRR